MANMSNQSTLLKVNDMHATVGDITADRVRAVLKAHGRLAQDVARMSDDDDLYEAGMTSLASVNVMLALEGEFAIEFPDNMLNRSVFASIGAIAAAVCKLDAA